MRCKLKGLTEPGDVDIVQEYFHRDTLLEVNIDQRETTLPPSSSILLLFSLVENRSRRDKKF